MNDRILPRLARVVAVVATMAHGVVSNRCRADEPDAETRAGWRGLAEHGNGFVVWESSRTGLWRIWRRDLDGSNLRQLTPEEPGRDQICPHLSPDGTRLTYINCPAGHDPNKSGNPLHLIQSDGSNDRVLVPSARAYGGDRAVVWFDNQRLVYIDSEGYTCELDLASGKSLRRSAEAAEENGLIINVTGTYATIGYPPTFSAFDSKTLRVTPQASLPGCEPYFTHDGRWGFWMGGAGGPINRFELATREASPILLKDDPRMPKSRAYVYFPMASRDGRYFTFGASPNQHDHDKSDYDIFVARMNPKTLELIGRPVRYTFDPATDRYPDVFGGGLPNEPAEDPQPRTAASPASWPANRDGLVYLMQTTDAPNQVVGADGKSRSYALHPRGRARPDHNLAQVLGGGSYVAEGAGADLLQSLRSRNELTIEADLQPDHLQQNGPARIVSYSSTAASRNFTLAQQDDRLIFRLRTSKTDLNGVTPEVEMGHLTDVGPSHIVVTYRPGELLCYRDGLPIHRDDRIQGDFSNWSDQELLFGDELDGQRDWAGTLEGVAIFSRALSADEVRKDFEQYRDLVAARPKAERIDVSARLLAKSPVPTLDEVKPYRGALMTCRYEIISVSCGALSENQILVNQWALLDGQTQPVAALEPGAEVRLRLEPAEQNPQLQRYVCKDAFNSDAELLMPRYYDITP